MLIERAEQAAAAAEQEAARIAAAKEERQRAAAAAEAKAEKRLAQLKVCLAAPELTGRPRRCAPSAMWIPFCRVPCCKLRSPARGVEITP